MTELLDETILSLDPSAATASWCADGVSALRSRLRTGGLPYRVVIDHSRTIQATLVDTFDWRVLGSGRIALLLEGEGNGGERWDRPGRRGRRPATEATPPYLSTGSTGSAPGRDGDCCTHHDRTRTHPGTSNRPGSRSRSHAGSAATPAPAPTPITPALPVGDSFLDLSASVAPRVLLRMGGGELALRRGRLVNDSGKTEAIVDEIVVDGMPDHFVENQRSAAIPPAAAAARVPPRYGDSPGNTGRCGWGSRRSRCRCGPPAVRF